jgi:hypothetical protein
MSLFMAVSVGGLAFVAKALDQSGDVLGPPGGCAWGQLDGLGKTPGLAADPPRASADRDDLKNLVQTEKTSRGDVGKHGDASLGLLLKGITGFQNGRFGAEMAAKSIKPDKSIVVSGSAR